MNKAQNIFNKISGLKIIPEVRPVDLLIEANKIKSTISRNARIRSLLQEYPQLASLTGIKAKAKVPSGKISRSMGLDDLEKTM
jgi:hypothetical protein